MLVAPPTDARARLPFWCLSTLWILILVLCFTAQQVVIVHLGKPYDAYLALSWYGMKSGHLWELFTCQLLNCGPIHLLVNLACLWFLGRAVEAQLGSRRFLWFCLGTSLAGALLQGGVALMGILLPESIESVASFIRYRYGGPVDGASIGPSAILMAFGLIRSERSGRLGRIVPVNAKYWMWLMLGVAVLLVIIPSNPDLPHVAHLGAMLAAVAIIRRSRCHLVDSPTPQSTD